MSVQSTLSLQAIKPALLFIGAIVLSTSAIAVYAQSESTTAVSARPLSQLLIRGELRANAEVIPRQRSQISAETTARIAATPVEVGERVERGAVLVKLDRRDAQLRVAAAKAALDAAQAGVELGRVRLERAGQLAAKNFVSADELKERQALTSQDESTLALRKSELDLARRELDRCTIKAPFAGWVTVRQAQVGQLASLGSALVQLVEDGHSEISAQLNPSSAAQLSVESTVVFIDERERRLALTWLRTSAVIDRSTRQMEARFGFTDTAAPAGSSGRIVWRRPAGRLPAVHLVRRDGKLGVLLAEGDRARFHSLPGADAGRPAEVDLPAQTMVITEGQKRLNDGDRIALNP